MPRPTFKKSIVWHFFDLSTNKKEAVCKLCKKTYLNHGNTSNLKDHLKRKHPIQLEIEENERAGVEGPPTVPSKSMCVLIKIENSM